MSESWLDVLQEALTSYSDFHVGSIDFDGNTETSFPDGFSTQETISTYIWCVVARHVVTIPLVLGLIKSSDFFFPDLRHYSNSLSFPSLEKVKSFSRFFLIAR